MARFPTPFVVEQIRPDALFDMSAPLHLAAIRQRWIEVGDETSSVRTVSRFDRQVESWLDLADLPSHCGVPVVIQASFLATALSPGDALWLEQESMRADELLACAVAARNAVLVRRAQRTVDTLVDLSESFSGPLWIGSSPSAPTSRCPVPCFARSPGCVTNELDVIHAHQASPIVADRRRLVGGYEIADLTSWPDGDCDLVRTAWELRLPSPALGAPDAPGSLLPDRGGPLLPLAHSGRPAASRTSSGCEAPRRAGGPPAGGPSAGAGNGRRRRLLGAEGSQHLWALGATGAGKSTLIRLCARHDLENGRPFVLIDAHGDLARAVRSDAAELGRDLALIDVDETSTLAFDLLGGVPLADFRRVERREPAVAG